MKESQFRAYRMNLISLDQGDSDDDFYGQIHCEISEIGKPGGEAIIVYVSGSAKEDILFEAEKNFIWNGDTLILKKFDEKELLSAVQILIDEANAKNWDELVNYLGSKFFWI